VLLYQIYQCSTFAELIQYQHFATSILVFHLLSRHEFNNIRVISKLSPYLNLILDKLLHCVILITSIKL
jgi:hypothetical protein